MNILISANDRYLVPLLVMLTSLVNSNKCKLDIFFLYGDSSENVIDAVADFAKDNSASLHLIRMEDDFFNEMPTAPYISVETYYRLAAASLLPAGIERILWLDADVLITGDIGNLYNIELNDNYIAACRTDECNKQKIVQYCKDIGVTAEDYVNAGVMLINMKAWRQHDVYEKVRGMSEALRRFKYADQDAVNVLFKEKILHVDKKYNYQVRIDSDISNCEEAESNACVIHFLGKFKPWNFNDLPLNDVWMKYYKMSPLRKEKLHRISSKKLSEFVAKAGNHLYE